MPGLQILGDDALQDNPNWVTPPESRSEGLEAALEEAFDNGPLLRLGRVAEKEIDNTWPQQTMDEDNWKTSKFFRGDIKFKDISNSQGLVSSQYAEVASHAHDQRIVRNERMASMPPGILSGADRFIGTTIGFMGDPINGAASVFAPEFVGVRSVAILGRVAELSKPVQISVKAGIGVVEGTAVVTPQIAIEASTDQALGLPINSSEMLSTLAFGAATGGLVRGLFGFKQAITRQGHQAAMETSVGQAASGKAVDVEPILDHSYHQQREIDAGRSGQDFEDQEAIEEYKGKINEAIAGKEKNLIEKISALPKTDENVKMLDVLGKSSEDRSAEDISFMDDYLTKGESSAISARAELEKNDIESLKNNQELHEAGSEEHTRLQESIDKLEEKQNLNDTRLEELRSGKSSEIKDEQLVKLRNELEETDYNQKAITGMQENSGTPVAKEDVENYNNKMNSYKSDSSYHPGKQQAYQERVASVKDNANLDVSEAQQSYENLVPEEARDEFDESAIEDINERETDFNTFADALRSVKDCLLRNL